MLDCSTQLGELQYDYSRARPRPQLRESLHCLYSLHQCRSRFLNTTPQSDFYEILGVPQDAHKKKMKDVSRARALKHLPYGNKEPGAGDKFKEIAKAYAVLSEWLQIVRKGG